MFSKYTRYYIRGEILTVENKRKLLSCFKIKAANRVVDLNNYAKVSEYEKKVTIYNQNYLKYIDEVRKIEVGTENYIELLSKKCISIIDYYFYNKYFNDIKIAVKNAKGMSIQEENFINNKITSLQFKTLNKEFEINLENIDLNNIYLKEEFETEENIINRIIEYALSEDRQDLISLSNDGNIILSFEAYKKYVCNKERLPVLKKDRIKSSVNRSYLAIDNLAKANADSFKYFLTLTFANVLEKEKHLEMNSKRDSNDIDLKFKYVENAKDFKECSKKLHSFFTNLKKAISSDLKYLGVPEYQKNGNIHYHFLISELPEELLYKIPKWLDWDNETKRYNNGYGLKNWSYGKSDISKIRDKARITSYIEKYLVKDLDEQGEYYDMRFNKQRYYKSNNLIKPIINYNTDIDLENAISVYETVKYNSFNNSEIINKVVQLKEL